MSTDTRTDPQTEDLIVRGSMSPSDPTEPLIDIKVTLPASVAANLKHRTKGVLDIAETIALITQLYQDAPLERRAVVLDEKQYGRACAVLGFSPQTIEAFVAGIEELARISFGGVRLQLTAEEVGIVNARNASGLTNKEWAKQIFREMFEAWINGRI